MQIKYVISFLFFSNKFIIYCNSIQPNKIKLKKNLKKNLQKN